MAQDSTVRLTADRVRELFDDCLSRSAHPLPVFDPEGDQHVDVDPVVIVDGVINQAWFNPVKLEEHRTEIAVLLAELPEQFHVGTGGGWSFLNACMDRHGIQWAEQPTVEKLMMLGLGTGLASYPIPRDMWSVLPGGVPYFVVNSGATGGT
jgi:hypothetical protein